MSKEFPSFGKKTLSVKRKDKYPSFGNITVHDHSLSFKRFGEKKVSAGRKEFPTLLKKAGERGSHGLGIHNGSKGARKNPHFPRLLK